MSDIESQVSECYRSWSGEEPVTMEKLPGSGSGRLYFRLHGSKGPVVGVYNDDLHENEAFISFAGRFRKEGLPVPEVLAVDPGKHIYMLDDLGDMTLYRLLTETRTAGDPFPEEVIGIYRKAISWLPVFQVKAGQKLDYTVCYPRAVFDRQSMMWDLNYFKYYFLKLARVPFDEQALEDDFSALCALLSSEKPSFFLYRDFQSRNIMVRKGEPWFIDFQGGRKGALQYDIASLLIDAKADMPFDVRRELLDFYLDRLSGIHPVDRQKFMSTYYGFMLIRILQALGAYGFRGYYENKPHFLLSIPYALRNLKYLRTNGLIGFGLDALMEVIDKMIEKSELYAFTKMKAPLTVTINSFSYKRAIPVDRSGNGGGFVFDCRALPNPGKMEEFVNLTGKDQPVAGFLKKEQAVELFLGHACSLVDQSVKKYIERQFTDLMVSFGCTGGRHRSVYCAEELAGYLRERYEVTVVVNHTEQEIEARSMK